MRPKYIVACCGHMSTEEYIERSPLRCCAKCAKAMDQRGRKDAQERLASLRHELAVYCAICKRDVEPLEESEAPLSVFWKRLDAEKGKELTLNAHHRHTHTDYDKARLELERQGWTSREARKFVRYGSDS